MFVTELQIIPFWLGKREYPNLTEDVRVTNLHMYNSYCYCRRQRETHIQQAETI